MVLYRERWGGSHHSCLCLQLSCQPGSLESEKEQGMGLARVFNQIQKVPWPSSLRLAALSEGLTEGLTTMRHATPASRPRLGSIDLA